jgi:hypothetical protein
MAITQRDRRPLCRSRAAHYRFTVPVIKGGRYLSHHVVGTGLLLADPSCVGDVPIARRDHDVSRSMPRWRKATPAATACSLARSSS